MKRLFLKSLPYPLPSHGITVSTVPFYVQITQFTKEFYFMHQHLIELTPVLDLFQMALWSFQNLLDYFWPFPHFFTTTSPARHFQMIFTWRFYPWRNWYTCRWWLRRASQRASQTQNLGCQVATTASTLLTTLSTRTTFPGTTASTLLTMFPTGTT